MVNYVIKNYVLMLQRVSAVWNELFFWFTFHFFFSCCIFVVNFALQPSKNSSYTKYTTTKMLSDSESQLFSIMNLPHINRAHVGCVFMLLSLLCLTARSLGDLYLYVVYFGFFSLMNEVENTKWFQTSYHTFVSHWTKWYVLKIFLV